MGIPRKCCKCFRRSTTGGILDLQKILTLVDARKLSDERYTQHQTFNQQIAIADIIVGNKLDLYQGEDKIKLERYVKQYGAAEAQTIFTKYGEIAPNHLKGKTAATVRGHLHNSAEAKPLLSEAPIPECGYIKAINEGEGFHSIGWRFSPSRGQREFQILGYSQWLQGFQNPESV